MKAYRKDILQTILIEKKRFASIMVITVLGVTMFCGLRAACQDLRYSADVFYDKQGLYDISIMSTYGLTEDDLAVLSNESNIEKAEGAFSESVQLDIVDVEGVSHNKTAEVRGLSQMGINVPYVVEGTLPANENEIAVSTNYLEDTGKNIGDTLTFTEDEEDDNINFLVTEYTITASVIDVMDVNNKDGTMSFRDSSTDDYTFFVTDKAIDSDIFTAIYLTVSEASEYMCYTDEYQDYIDEIIDSLTANVKSSREQARYDDIAGDAQEELDEKKAEAEKEFAKAEEEIEDAKADIENTKLQLAYVREYLPAEEIAAIEAQIEAGETQISESESSLEEEREKAEEEFAKAQSEIDEVERPVWYIQDRTTLSGYSNVGSDADCIESIGKLFPILFLTLAILISLTTITRMVEEERGLIGTYKALGFTDKEIRRKYIVYSGTACLCGAIIGDIGGFLVLPSIIIWIFRSSMYQIPEYLYRFDWIYGIGGMVLFIIAIVGATYISCEAELSHTPASLMRPKAPKSGSRIFLERIKPIWSRLSFLNKVTARNIFRYKKRMLMTIFGIMGCTALILCGFVIKDSVKALSANQYGYVYNYDILAVTSGTDYEEFISQINDMSEVKDYIELRVENVKVKHDEEEISVQLFVNPDGVDYAGYLNLENSDKEPIVFEDGYAYATINAGNVTHFTEGDTIQIQNSKLSQVDALAGPLVTNYMGNTVYMTQSTYENLFGEYEPNAILLHTADTCDDELALKDTMENIDGVVSAVSIEESIDSFSTSVLIINVVVYIIIVLAAALAFVVLFTLANTNISERERELATIKVLGFFDNEVHLYINKETMILTSIGIILGLPFGNVLGRMLMAALNMPSLYFAVSIEPVSYIYAAALSFIFALLVNCITNRTLNHIDPVEALKSVE